MSTVGLLGFWRIILVELLVASSRAAGNACFSTCICTELSKYVKSQMGW